jgi:16S rRNA (cytidine1402-2'-O)-methyltransferase
MAVDQNSPHTLIFYESPFRLVDFLKDALAVYGDRPAAVANDLTKKFETITRAPLSELIARFEKEEKILGEYTVVIAGKKTRSPRCCCAPSSVTNKQKVGRFERYSLLN